MEIAARVFWSYAHADNEREDGRILRLADRVRDEYETLTGATIEIFTDRSGIAWGDDFRQRIDQALQEVAFFVPILTPTYFLREECRKEMSQFVRSAAALGLQQLLLSIRYSQVPDLIEGSADELKAVAAQMQFEPWEDLRLVDEGSARHRAAVNRLASRLVDLTTVLESGGGGADPSGALRSPTRESAPADGANADLASESAPPADEIEHPEPTQPAPQTKGDDDESPGLIDLIADAQPSLEAWNATVGELNSVSRLFNEKFAATTRRMNEANSRPDAFARKLVAARELAIGIEPELSELERLSKTYLADLLRIDSTIRAVFEVASMSMEEGAVEGEASLKSSLASLFEISRDAMRSLEGAADAARSNAKLSRDLRPILRRYETAIRNIVDGSAIIEEWNSLGRTDLPET